MKVWYFSEMSFHPAWGAGKYLRNELSNQAYDPLVGSDLYNRYLDEYALCDELGLNIMVNEHHSTATCLNVACAIPLGILARQTKKARLLALGMPIANRTDPMRVAEEFAMIDVISRGRLEMGLVKGSPYEVFPANSNPVQMMDRFWEAHDLIVTAMTAKSGPISWEGRYFNYRNVNLWPRPYQNPHPPIWMTASSPATAESIAEKGYVLATLNSGYARTRPLFDAYRNKARHFGCQADSDRFAYLAIVAVGRTKKEGFARADKIIEYVRNAGRVAPQFVNPPGYAPVAVNARMLKSDPSASHQTTVQTVTTRDGRKISRDDFTVENMIDAGIAFAGTPDMVYDQIKEFHDHVGGFGHLLMMAQGAWLTHDETVSSLKLFSSEVLPRLPELSTVPAAVDDRRDRQKPARG
jgi:alkanesulfonate monooxygenase SsuD/methylene tetrahydromethanopterin reductase-like flavin-dependent oxidoreductase (luciferase family)